MVFVDNRTDLEYYFPASPQWSCYYDAVFAPYDILLQIPSLPVMSTYTATINTCDASGEFIADDTANFDSYLGSFMIGGATYYFINIRCNSISAAMIGNACFTLNIVINDGSSDVFNKYTQAYILQGAAATGTVYVPGVYIDDGFEETLLDNCVVGANSANCNVPYVKFKSTFDCFDSFLGEYYAEGAVISGVGIYPFAFYRASWLEARIKKLTTEISRTVSLNCRTQKTARTKKYQLVGANKVFSQWKVDEIENMMLGNHLYVDDVEYQSEGGTIFEQFGRPFNCQYRFKLTMPLQDCYEWQIHGCVQTCEDLAYYYLFPTEFARIYNDQQQSVATDLETLEIFFQSMPGYKSISNLPFLLPCPVYALMRVISTGVLPKYLYVDEVVPANRIFPKQLPLTTLDLTSLCNGITNNNQVTPPDVGDIESQDINVPVPVIGDIESQNANEYILSFTVGTDWATAFATTSAVNYAGTVNLNLALVTTAFSSPFTSADIGDISTYGQPISTVTIYGNDNPNMPPNSVLVINTDGSVKYTGDATSINGNNYYLELYNIEYSVN